MQFDMACYGYHACSVQAVLRSYFWKTVKSILLNKWNVDGSVQDYTYSSALAMELLQSCTEPPMYRSQNQKKCQMDDLWPLLLTWFNVNPSMDK